MNSCCLDKINILLTRSMLEKDINYIKSGLDREIPGRYELVIPSSFDDGVLAEAAKTANVLLGPYISENILKNASELMLIQIPWTGLDTFNFSAVQSSDVLVCNTHSNSTAVAEMGISLLLDVLKKISYHDRKMRIGNWNRDGKDLDLTSKQLSDLTVCVLGCGNIGYKIAKIVNAFGSQVIAVDNNRKSDSVIGTVYSSDKMTDAIKSADVIISALPLTCETRGIINSDMIDNMKEGVVIINVSRAEIIVEDALYSALCSGKVAGFASDVWWQTPKRGESESFPSAKFEFWKMHNVVMSPHRAGFKPMSKDN